MSVESIVSLVAGKIGQLLVDEATFLYGVEGRVKNLEKELKWMRSALVDLEAKHHKSENETFRTAIEEIMDIAYEIEDVIDSYIADEVNEKATSKLRRYARCCSCLVRTHETGTKVDAIGEMIEQLTKRLKRYQVQLGSNGTSRVSGEQPRVTNKVKRPQSYPFEDMDELVVGLEEDVNNLVDKLTTVYDCHLYCIHGMGGSGKTTLARKIYNHPTIKIQFEHLVWISVSQEWSSIRILSEIFKKTGGKEVDQLGLENDKQRMLTEGVRTNLRNKRYLIVLDDVWTPEVVQEILPATPIKENQGSKIIITTRKKETVSTQGLPSDYFEPKKLDPEQSMELFKKIVLGSDRKAFDSNEYETLGQEMLKKCDGLPLAIIALGGILRTKENIQDWEKVQKDVSFKVMKEGKGTYLYGPVRDMLALSYYDLPYYLKPCFLYLGFFPEDSEIRVRTLIRMWMAEGFVTFEQRCGEETFEDAAVQLVEELVQRCMVQVSRWKLNGKANRIKIHDLFRELSISMAKDLRFLKVFEASSMLDNANPKQPRRASAFFEDEIGMQRAIQWFEKNSSLRSINLDNVNISIRELLPIMEHRFSSTWKLLMILRLVGIGTTDGILSAEIGGLAHLRYLEIYFCNIHQLPESIGNLRNLLTLDYRSVTYNEKGVRLPNSLGKLRNLRHLFLPFANKWEIYPERSRGLGLQHLKNLTILRVLGGIELERNGFLSWSQNIRKLEIRVSSTQQVQDLMSSCPCFRHSGSLLASLFLGGPFRFIPSVSELILLPNLQPLDRYCKHLQKLTLDGFSLVETTFFPSTLIVLRLYQMSIDAVSLKAIEKLPLLKCFRLVISYLEGNNKWICESGAFLQLQQLDIQYFKNLKEWRAEKGSLPRLTRLSITGCDDLERMVIPDEGFIIRLQHFDIERKVQVVTWDGNAGEDIDEFSTWQYALMNSR